MFSPLLCKASISPGRVSLRCTLPTPLSSSLSQPWPMEVRSRMRHDAPPAPLCCDQLWGTVVELSESNRAADRIESIAGRCASAHAALLCLCVPPPPDDGQVDFAGQQTQQQTHTQREQPLDRWPSFVSHLCAVPLCVAPAVSLPPVSEQQALIDYYCQAQLHRHCMRVSNTAATGSSTAATSRNHRSNAHALS